MFKNVDSVIRKIICDNLTASDLDWAIYLVYIAQFSYPKIRILIIIIIIIIYHS